VYLMIFWEEPASSAASLATAGAAAAADVAVAAVASTMPRRPASSNAAVQWPAWGLKDEMQGLGVAQLQKHAEFLALSTLTAVGKEVSVMFCRCCMHAQGARRAGRCLLLRSRVAALNNKGVCRLLTVDLVLCCC
jgi:hypothetical protein